MEEKIRIARKSFASIESVTAVAERHAITRRQLSSWRTQLRLGKLAARSSARTQSGVEAFAALDVEERSSVLIEGRGVTVRLEGMAEVAGIASSTAAPAGRR